MTTVETAGLLLIIGSFVFGVGAGVGVPRVFTERDRRARQRMVEERRGIWRIAQPLYGLGAIIAAVGVGYLAVDTAAQRTRAIFAVACMTLVIGALAWAWSLRGR